MYILFASGTHGIDLNIDFTLGNCLFGAVKLTKNNGLDKYRYSGYDLRNVDNSHG